MSDLQEVYDAHNNADLLNDSVQVESSLLDLTHSRRYDFSDVVLL